MENIGIKVKEKATGKELEDPVYYMGNWYKDWRAYEDGCEMDEGYYTVEIIIGLFK